MKIQFKRNQQAATESPGTLVAGEPVWFKDKLYIGSVGEAAGGTAGAEEGAVVFVGPDDFPVHSYTASSSTAGSGSSPYKTALVSVTDERVTEYKDGMIVAIRLPITGVITAGIAFQINDLGYHPMQYNASMLTTHFPAGSCVFMQYFAAGTGTFYNQSGTSSTITGVWRCNADYNADTMGVYIKTSDSTRKVASACYRYRLCFSSADDTKWVPANASTSTSATTSKAVTNIAINPFGRIIYYGSSSSVSSGNTLSASYQYQQYPVTLGYSFNTTGAALTLANPSPVYVKCTPQADGSAVIDATTPIVQALPSSKDGSIYIYLGQAYSATAITLTLEHPVFWHDGTGVRVWTGKEPPENLRDLLDVEITSPEDGHVLAYEASSQTWRNMPVDGGNF